MRKAGTVEIIVICGFTYNIYEEIEIATSRANSKIRLARVSWTDGENTYRDVGLVLDPSVAEELKLELDRKAIIEKMEKEKREREPFTPSAMLSDFNMFDD